MINRHQIRQLIKETLIELDLFSEDAVALLMGTMAQESDHGTYLKQTKGGTALSFFSIEPEMHDDHVKNYLKSHDLLAGKIKKACGVSKFDSSFLLYNIKYAICIARVHYKRVKDPIPPSIEGKAKYWKVHYNTRMGKSTESQFIYNYKKHVL